MRQTLFYIPQTLPAPFELGELPVFGRGWLLGLWLLGSLVVLGWQVARRGWRELPKRLPFVLAVAAVITILLPMLEVPPFGLPIRGYGMMLLLAVLSGIALAVYRAEQMQIEPDQIYSLAFWLFVAGIAGARLFYVIQYWPRIQEATFWGTLRAMIDFANGGLVVYGSLIGAAVAFILFVKLRRIPPLRLADAIAPSLLIGLALGRVGCLLNGCCYGGICEEGHFAITFPQYSAPETRTLSPPYHDQLVDRLQNGFLHGIRLQSSGGSWTISEVLPDSAAAMAGVTGGQRVVRIQNEPLISYGQAAYLLGTATRQISITTAARRQLAWAADELPARSRPVHPTQIYSTLNALLIFAMAWTYFPLRRRAGEICGLVLTTYPVTRFLMEWVRVDESGTLGTTFTISQWISLAILASMLVYWPFVLTRGSKR